MGKIEMRVHLTKAEVEQALRSYFEKSGVVTLSESALFRKELISVKVTPQGREYLAELVYSETEPEST